MSYLYKNSFCKICKVKQIRTIIMPPIFTYYIYVMVQQNYMSTPKSFFLSNRASCVQLGDTSKVFLIQGAATKMDPAKTVALVFFGIQTKKSSCSTVTAWYDYCIHIWEQRAGNMWNGQKANYQQKAKSKLPADINWSASF